MVRLASNAVLNWIDVTVTEVKSWVLVIFISNLMYPGNDVGWSNNWGECTEFDAAASTEVKEPVLSFYASSRTKADAGLGSGLH